MSAFKEFSPITSCKSSFSRSFLKKANDIAKKIYADIGRIKVKFIENVDRILCVDS